MSVIAKMRVSRIIDEGTSHVHNAYKGEAEDLPRRVIELSAVGGGTDELPEDQVFNLSTPVGSCSLTVINPLASEQFQVGDAFYVRFEKAA